MTQIVNDDTPSRFFEEIELLTLCSDSGEAHDAKLSVTRDSLSQVLQEFLKSKNIAVDHLAILDGFLFILNDPGYADWRSLNWWEQRKKVRAMKDHPIYIDRAQVLLGHSCFAPYLDHTDKMVAQSTDPQVKHAWMRKRLVLKESYWNAIDSFSHAAYFKNKYQELYPALCVLLCNIEDRNGRKTEFVLGIDNGTGFLYKKKSRESILIRFLYKICKCFFSKGVFYIGGLELGLMETDGELSCHGSGAVVYQGW